MSFFVIDKNSRIWQNGDVSRTREFANVRQCKHVDRCSSANSWTRWKPPANTPQHHVTVCSQLISTAHAWVLMHQCVGGGYCRLMTSTLVPLSAETAAAHRWRAYIWRFSMQVDESVYLHTKGQRFMDTGWKGVLVVDARTHFRALPRYLWARYRTLKHSERALQWGGACRGVYLALPNAAGIGKKLLDFFKNKNQKIISTIKLLQSKKNREKAVASNLPGKYTDNRLIKGHNIKLKPQIKVLIKLFFF